MTRVHQHDHQTEVRIAAEPEWAAADVRRVRPDAQHAGTDVGDSAVTLSSRVSSSHERGEAGQAASCSPSRTDVHSRRTVAMTRRSALEA